MSDQGKSRSRGRSRGRARQPDNVVLGGGSGPPPAPQGAWARRPGPPPAQAPPAQQPRFPPPGLAPAHMVPNVGRAPQRMGERDIGDIGRKMQDVTVGDGASVGRGAMRGRRQIVPEFLVTRPQNLITKQGNSGTRLNLQANYFKLLSTTDWCLYQYRVDFAPEEDRTVVRKALLRPHRETLGPYIFDGTVLYTSNRLPEKMELFSARQSDDAQIRIEIKEVGDLVRGDQHYIQFFNIIMRKCLDHLKLQLVGRDYYDAAAKIEIRDFQLELWPGYITSIRQHERDILMCSEISHKVMRQQTIYDILTDCHRQNRNDFKRAFCSQIIGQVVLTGYNNNTYRVDDVDFDVTPQSTFPLRSGELISYMDYYRNKYQITVRQPTQPMLVSRSKPRERRAGQAELVYLVPELCRATGITDEMRAQWQLMKALSDHMRVGPESRVQKLLAFNQRLRSQPDVCTDLKDWNLSLSDKLIDIPGRIMPSEKIIFGREKKVDAGPEADWTRELRNVTMLSCGKMDNWALIVTSRAKRDVENFVSTLIQVSTKLGFKLPQPRVHEVPDDRAQTYVEAIEAILSRLSVNLIFCVVPNNRPERYSAIKKKCCSDRPIPTQVFLAKNLTNKGLVSVATKVAIQMNCKIGGAPWTVEIPLSGLMIAGFDVCHDTASKGRDYGALVASLNRSFSQWFSAVSHHSNGEELSDTISTNICKALHAYRARNNALPQRIVIYRDGVGEGQVPYVYEHEVVQLKDRLAQVYGEQEFRLAFIIVTKRIKTRLFLQKRNPPPGTVVDDVITNPEKYDFFIVPQSVRQGSVSPTSFSVISDNVGLEADKLQRLTYKMCHMYYNWSGTVRVPAPCQYAHKLAFQVAQSIHRPPAPQLENLLYFL
ncbi:piwi-like protein Siwi [Diprion similis]|uniref:piwi-like protein Siwi n=1 Tax=Diprion similis TaxID=362088 RepID=UPI001EF7D869|nr:piwi-like protein Siwi [Diprion similis]